MAVACRPGRPLKRVAMTTTLRQRSNAKKFQNPYKYGASVSFDEWINGMENQFEFIADCISKVIDVLSSNDESLINKVEILVLQEIRKLCQNFPIYK